MFPEETQGTASQPAEGASEPTNLEAVATPQEQTATTETPEGEQPAEQAGDKPEGEEEKTERKRLSGAQKAKRRETFLLNQLAEAQRELEMRRQASQRPDGSEGDADKPPKEDDFNGDWGKYIAAQAAYEVKQGIKAEARAERERNMQADQAGVWRERMADHQDRVEELKETVKDFDQVVRGVNISIRQELGEEIVASENSALLQYHLAKNPDKLHELNAMSGRELARAIGRLEATLKLPSAKTQTTAKPPLASLKGGAAPAFDPIKSDNMDDFAAWLRKDLEKRSGRR